MPPSARVARQCVECDREGITSKRKAPHPGPRCATHHRAKRRERSAGTAEKRWMDLYGITAEEYWAIYEYQGGCCYICQRANGAKKRLSVDHDHATGLIRGELCTMCNKYILGWSRDDPEMLQRAIEYLNRPPAIQVIGERIAPKEYEKLGIEHDT